MVQSSVARDGKERNRTSGASKLVSGKALRIEIRGAVRDCLKKSWGGVNGGFVGHGQNPK